MKAAVGEVTVCTLFGEVIETENLTAPRCDQYVEDRDAR